MENEIEKLQARIKELEERNKWAVEEIHSLANEQMHREHGCEYAVVSSEELFEIEDILTGKTPL
jgi:tetrahydromethanopterin S-methyltransferase subunit G